MPPVPARADDFGAVAALAQHAVADRITPAITIEVGSASAVRWQHAAGQLTYADAAPRCTLDTAFDLASLTKVIVTASLAMHITEFSNPAARWLDTPIAALEPRWRGT